jgi:glycine oxidase
MNKVIVVGGGLAGMVLAFRLHEADIPFMLINNPALSKSSRVAAGLWNPMVFKRTTKSWMADELIPELHSFYSACEIKTGKTFLSSRISIKPFTEEQEKQLWSRKVARELSAFADEKAYTGVPPGFECCRFTNGYGKITESGNLYIKQFIEAGERFFHDRLVVEDFDFTQVEVGENKLSYKGVPARALVFCEGHLVKHNPYFSWIPLKPAKGELLHIEAPDLKFKDGVFNRNGFILDVKENVFIVGSTYNWTDLNDVPSEQGRAELTNKLNHMISCNYSVLSHLAGVRPSSVDRRPILGVHPKHNTLFVFNGLGAKGVMLAPYFAQKFVHFLSKKQTLPGEVDVARFYKLYAG